MERLRLLCAFGAGNRYLSVYIDPSDPCGSYDRLLHDDKLAGDRYASALRRLSDMQMNSILETCRRYRIKIVTPDDDGFPEQLLNIDCPPLLLFVLGDLAPFNNAYSAAIVGCREPVDYSLAVAGCFSGFLAQKGVAIISGFARGIDTAAHTAAIRSGGITAAVLGCGVLCDYPKGTMPFRKEISEHGAVISEYLPTERPAREHFRVRNRLISGLADCVIVAEASPKSGALNTATHAAEQGREVYVIPPSNIFAERFAGQSGLLEDGAD